MRAYVRQRDLNLARFFLLNHFRAGLQSELCWVLNLQNQVELWLNNAVKLATIDARSREENKCASKVYATEVGPEDSDDPQIDALQLQQAIFREIPSTTGSQK
jgi:hypothetical protein